MLKSPARPSRERQWRNQKAPSLESALSPCKSTLTEGDRVTMRTARGWSWPRQSWRVGENLSVVHDQIMAKGGWRGCQGRRPCRGAEN